MWMDGVRYVLERGHNIRRIRSYNPFRDRPKLWGHFEREYEIEESMEDNRWITGVAVIDEAAPRE